MQSAVHSTFDIDIDDINTGIVENPHSCLVMIELIPLVLQVWRKNEARHGGKIPFGTRLTPTAPYNPLKRA